MIVVPTIDIPPNRFNTPENRGFLEGESLVYEPATSVPQRGMILLMYFTKTGTDVPISEEVKSITLDNEPYA